MYNLRIMSPVYFSLLLILAFLVCLALLIVACRLYGIYELGFGRIALAALATTILAVMAVGMALVLAGVFNAKDLLGDQTGILIIYFFGAAYIAVMAATLAGCWLVLRQACLDSDRWWRLSITTAVFFPLVFSVLAIGGSSLMIRKKEQQHDQQYNVRNEQAKSLVAEYGLPPLTGLNCDMFFRDKPDTEFFFVTLVARQVETPVWPVSEPSPSDLHKPWEERSADYVAQAQNGLKGAGYSVERSAGVRREYYVWRRGGSGGETKVLRDVVLTGKRGDHFVVYLIGYHPTEGISYPLIELQFGRTDQLSRVKPRATYPVRILED